MNNLNKLYAKLSQIGIRVSYNDKEYIHSTIDIERTIIETLYYIDEDGRLLGLVFSWLKIHGSHLISDKFFKEYKSSQKYFGETPWFSAVCAYMTFIKDPRFKKGITIQKRPYHFQNQNQNSLIKIKGAVPYLHDIGIMVPLTSLRIRESDVLTIAELINSNRQYQNRFVFGPNWRAEIITAIQNGLDTPMKISKELGIARSRVGVVFKEYSQIKNLMDFS